MAIIEIDPGAGFCFGVDQVIHKAESLLKKGEKVYGLGEMVHNAAEVQRLQDLGLKTVDHRNLASIKPARLLLRAHGEPPSTYQLAESHNIEIIDGTCPIVTRLQKKIREAYDTMDHDTEQLVIFGNTHHPETIGLLGQVDGDAVVVSTPDELSKVVRNKKVILFSQTTMDPDLFSEVEKELKRRMKGSAGTELRSNCTICGQMKKRKPGLSSFARKHDLVLFVSGRNSSNGKMLFEFCKSVNPRTHWISGNDEVEPGWFSGIGSIGISGATSTSITQLESIGEHVKKLTSS